MKIVIAAVLVCLALPALAATNPTPAKGANDSRVCDVNFSQNDIVAIKASPGDNVTVRFGDKEVVGNVAASDTAHLQWGLAGTQGNIVMFKAIQPMPAQPVAIRTIRNDGQPPRDYIIQWSAAYPESPKPKAVAAIGDVSVADVSPEPPPATPCYLVRYQYPNEVDPEKLAAWRAAAMKKKQDAEEIALHAANKVVCRNVHYVAKGDSFIAPTSICDDGQTTELRFAGTIPVILGVNSDSSDRQLSGVTVEDNGVVKIHEVPAPYGKLPVIRLRSGDLLLCIFNIGYAPYDPKTGTISPDIVRTVRSTK